jgi:WG containing repeat
MNFKFWLIAVLLFLSINTTFSQFYNSRYLIPYREHNLWGFSDTLGNIRVKPVFDETNFFYMIGNHYYAAVSKDNKRSFINDTGKLVFPFSDSLVHLTDEFYYARENNKYGVYHMRHKLLVPFVYDTFMSIKDYPLYKQNGYYKLIGRKDTKYYLITYVNNKTEEIEKPEPAPEPKSVTLIERPNSVLVQAVSSGPITTVSATELFAQSRISVLKQNKKSGVVNEKNEILVPCIYDSILVLSDNLFITIKRKKYGAVFLNSMYRSIPNKYEKLEYFTSLPVTSKWHFLLFKAVKNNKKGFVGENGIEYFVD